MRLFLCIEILLFFISILQTCRKTQREWTGSELIGKVGGKLEGKGTQATGGDHHFCVTKYPADLHWISI
jgi:hypothetical protein